MWSWVSLDNNQVIFGNPYSSKAERVGLLKLEERDKLMNIQTLKSKKELELVQ